MNDRGLDGLFRERLKDFKTAPSGAIWPKLEGKLASKKKGVWWNIGRAAATLALVALSVYLFNARSGSQPATVSEISSQTANELEQTSPNEATVPQMDVIDPSVSDQIIINDAESRQLAASDQTTKLHQHEPASPTTQKATNLAQNEIEAAPNTTEITVAAKSDMDPVPSDIPSRQEDSLASGSDQEPATPQKPKITITYKKAPSPPEPTLALVEDTEVKSSKVKKIWRKAMIKSAELDLGKLRAAKNQLLVFNKKNKDKQTKSN